MKAYKLDMFIETGTYLGHTVEHVLDQFKYVFTFELDPKLAAAARWKFEAHPNVVVTEGDSGSGLRLWGPGPRRSLIWLDAHWSGGITAQESKALHTAVRTELEVIRRWEQHTHVLMIDDLDDFNGEHDYPTRMELMDLVYAINPAYSVRVLDIRRGVLVALPPA